MKGKHMKTVLFSLGALVLLGFIVLIVMAIMSQKAPDTLGLKDGKLAPCPESPNCVCSEQVQSSDKEHFIQPIQADKALWAKFKAIIQEQGAEIITDDGNYVHATFSTPVFHYVDDVELRFDEAASLIHIRSASRMGRSDFGVNRARVEKLKQAL